MATTKTFSVAGTSTLNGVTKVRFANDFVSRLKILYKNGHENVELIEMGGEFTKAEICQILMNHAKFQSEDQQGAIYEFVVRNCKEIKSQIEEKMQEAEAVEA
jgi:hypothetical protein